MYEFLSTETEHTERIVDVSFYYYIENIICKNIDMVNKFTKKVTLFNIEIYRTFFIHIKIKFCLILI